MAYIVYCQVRYCWVPDGAAGAIGQEQGDFPAYGSFTPAVGTVPAAQEASDMAGAWVPGGDAPTDANFQTALNNMAAYLYTNASTAGDVPGFTTGKLTDLMRAWSTGSP
jgi:hypothetical protein